MSRKAGTSRPALAPGDFPTHVKSSLSDGSCSPRPNTGKGDGEAHLGKQVVAPGSEADMGIERPSSLISSLVYLFVYAFDHLFVCLLSGCCLSTDSGLATVLGCHAFT